MNLHRIKPLLIKNSGLIIVFPLLVAVLVYFLVGDQPRQYTSNASVYTGFASGYTLESAEGGNGSSSTNSEWSSFDNLINMIKAKSTLEEVSVRLLAHYLSGSPYVNDTLLHKDAVDFLSNTIPARVRRQMAGKPYESVLKELSAGLREKEQFMEEVVNSEGSPFGIRAIMATLKTSRLGSSDMLEVSFQATNPTLAQLTLTQLIDTFIKKYKETKTGEIKSVVAYFENQLKEASIVLKNKEDSLQIYSSSNNIVNFEEDSRAISFHRKDIENQIQQEMSALASTEAVLNQLNAKLVGVRERASRNTNLNDLRDSISALNTKLFVLENSPGKQENVAALKARIQQLEARSRRETNGLSASINSGEGVPPSLLLTSWIDATLEVDRIKARVRSLRELQVARQSEFNSILPAGLVINRLKRDITLAEQNYLQVLQNLNASRLKEQGLNTTLNMRVFDAPTLPADAEPSKTNMLILLSFIAALFLVTGYVVGKDMLDTTVKDLDTLRKRTGLPFAGALPDLTHPNAGAGSAEVQLFNQCINTINPHFQEDASPLVITLFSTQAGDGKTYYGKKLLKYLNASGYKTVLSSSTGSELSHEASSSTSSEVAVMPGYADLPGPVGMGKAPYQIVLVELESINTHVLPINLIKGQTCH